MEQPLIHGDNQQETGLHWLGGIMDGEGSFMITRKRTGKKLFLYPDIAIANSNPIIIDSCAVLIDPICGFHIETRLPKVERYLRMWRIRILGFNRCRKFLTAIIPYVRGKKEEAKHLLKFVQTCGENNLQLREQMKKELLAIRAPQRLYAKQYQILKI